MRPTDGLPFPSVCCGGVILCPTEKGGGVSDGGGGERRTLQLREAGGSVTAGGMLRHTWAKEISDMHIDSQIQREIAMAKNCLIL